MNWRFLPRVERLDDRATPAVLVTLAAGAAPSPAALGGLEPLAPGVYRAADGFDPARLPGVVAVEPDAPVRADQVPNDPSEPAQYALKVVQAPAAWDVATGTGRTVVAVIDSGIDLSHPDLAANLWTNPGEVPGNGRDDDRDGYVDDVHGYDFLNNTGNPIDQYGHGTHVAGVLGAVGDNGVGVAGIDWHAGIMPLRFLDATGNGSTGDAVRALNYAVDHGARIANCSWGTGVRSAALTAAIGRAQAAGVIVVAAAGNNHSDLAVAPNYPASYATEFDNVVSVAATDSGDRLAGFSDYGAAVTLAAPGDGILSTLPGGRYGTKTGTSVAAPFVSGALALLWDAHPDWSYARVIAQLKATVDPLPSLAGKVQTGGRLDVARLLGGAATAPVPPADPGAPSAGPAGEPVGFVPTPVTPLPAPHGDAVAVGVAAPGEASVQLLGPGGATLQSLVVPGGDFAGGVRPVTADLTGDGVPDLVLASSPGVPGRVRVLDGATHAVLWDIVPFGPDFTGGVFVACGDLTGDGVPDIAITPDQGGGPRVRVFDGRTFAQVADFFGIDDPAFRGGARAAIGDLSGDGVGDLVVAAGYGGGPRVAVFDGTTVRGTPRRVCPDFFVFEPSVRNGVYVAVGDINGDGVGDLVAGAGPGGGPRVTVFSGRQLGAGVQTPLADFFAGDPGQRDGVRVAVKDLDGDARADVVVGGTGRAAGYTGKSLAAAADPTSGFGFDVPLGGDGGVFVG